MSVLITQCDNKHKLLASWKKQKPVSVLNSPEPVTNQHKGCSTEAQARAGGGEREERETRELPGELRALGNCGKLILGHVGLRGPPSEEEPAWDFYWLPNLNAYLKRQLLRERKCVVTGGLQLKRSTSIHSNLMSKPEL